MIQEEPFWCPIPKHESTASGHPVCLDRRSHTRLVKTTFSIFFFISFRFRVWWLQQTFLVAKGVKRQPQNCTILSSSKVVKHFDCQHVGSSWMTNRQLSFNAHWPMLFARSALCWTFPVTQSNVALQAGAKVRKSNKLKLVVPITSSC